MSFDAQMVGLGISLAFLAAGDLRLRWPLCLFGLSLAAAAAASLWGARLF